jgi:hypothetical protein
LIATIGETIATMSIRDSEALRQAKTILAKHNEIEIRYANAVKWRPRPDVAEQRITQLSALFRHRYGELMTGYEDLYLIAQHMAKRPNFIKRLTAFASLRAQWMTADRLHDMAADVIANPRWYSAAELGELVRLTREERDDPRLNITRFRAAGVTWAEMQAERKRKDKERKAEKRRKAGAKPQSQSAARTKPWKALGETRTQYYERMKAEKSGSTLAADERVQKVRTVSSPPIETRDFFYLLGLASPAHGPGHIRVKLSPDGMARRNQASTVLTRARLAPLRFAPAAGG